MVERENGKEPKQYHETILSRDVIDFILEGARENLSTHGSLVATLFMRLDNGQRTITPLSLPRTSDEKQIYFALLGLSIRETGREIQEAIMVSESWYVTPDGNNPPEVAPSKHPNRKEAISLVGRDAIGFARFLRSNPFIETRRITRSLNL